MGDCGPWCGAGEELLGATLDGTAGRRPNRGCGPRAAADATRHNVTTPHRPRTYRDAGRERASGAAGRSTRQAGASTSSLKAPLAVDSDGVAGLKWTGGEVRYRSSHADVGRAEQSSVHICATGHAYQSPIVTDQIRSLLSIGFGRYKKEIRILPLI